MRRPPRLSAVRTTQFTSRLKPRFARLAPRREVLAPHVVWGLSAVPRDVRSPMPPLSTLTARATHARPLLPAALASVSYGFVLVRVRVPRDVQSRTIVPPSGLASRSGYTRRLPGEVNPAPCALPVARPGWSRCLGPGEWRPSLGLCAPSSSGRHGVPAQPRAAEWLHPPSAWSSLHPAAFPFARCPLLTQAVVRSPGFAPRSGYTRKRLG